MPRASFLVFRCLSRNLATDVPAPDRRPAAIGRAHAPDRAAVRAPGTADAFLRGMKLYYSPGACSLAPHIVLREAELRFDLERVDLRSQRTASGTDFMMVNPKGQVPALKLDDGELLTEVSAILQYLGDRVPQKKLVAPNGTMARYRIQEWLNFLSAELHKQFAPLFQRDTNPRVASQQRGKVSERLLYLVDVLDDRAYLMGETFTVPDAYLFTMLQWTRRQGMDLGLWPRLDEYEAHIAERPAVREAFAAEGLVEQHVMRRSA